MQTRSFVRSFAHLAYITLTAFVLLALWANAAQASESTQSPSRASSEARGLTLETVSIEVCRRVPLTQAARVNETVLVCEYYKPAPAQRAVRSPRPAQRAGVQRRAGVTTVTHYGARS